MKLQGTRDIALNAICPYFTMFPLDFPLGILRKRAAPRDRVLDPFCGRGTTNFAARLLGLETLGIDSNPVAAAITSAKLVQARPEAIVREAETLIRSERRVETPIGEFWTRAYDPDVLRSLCSLRSGLRKRRPSAARCALNAIVLGALHGPLQKTFASYFSNQSPRTYAPKPAYAARYWRKHRMKAPKVDVLGIIRRRAEHYYGEKLPAGYGDVMLADSRSPSTFESAGRFRWVITSPPYYGLRTYLQDQWLRNWFLGGPEMVDYSSSGQLSHTSADAFADQLRQVWNNASAVCRDGAMLVIRFGGIRDRSADPRELLTESLRGTEWRLITVNDAGHAGLGKRQANAFLSTSLRPSTEHDFWARLG